MHLTGLLMLLGIGLAIGLAAAVAYTVRILTHPPRRGYAWAVSRHLPGDPAELASPVPYDRWTFTSRGLAFPAWDLIGDDPTGPTVIVTHGWGDSRVIALRSIPALRAVSRRLILWDLPGHGEAPGICSLGTCEIDDLRALIDRLCTPSPAAPAGPLILYGSSLGAGVSIAVAAADARVAAVIAEAPYRIPRIPARNAMRLAGLPWRVNLPLAMALLGLRFGYGLRWATDPAAGGFDRALHAARLTAPLLVLHGTDDAVCPIEDGRAITAAAPRGSIAQIPGAGHNSLWTQEPFATASAAAVTDFIRRTVRAASPGSPTSHQPAAPCSPADR